MRTSRQFREKVFVLILGVAAQAVTARLTAPGTRRIGPPEPPAAAAPPGDWRRQLSAPPKPAGAWPSGAAAARTAAERAVP
jgi:hypothetical protein